MRRIAAKAEASFDYAGWLRTSTPEKNDSTLAVSYAVAQLASLVKPAAIVTTTTSGQTSRLVSKFRPRVPILTATWSHRTRCTLSVVWGVQALHMGLPANVDEQMDVSVQSFKNAKMLKSGDKVIISAGVPAGRPGHTNLIFLDEVS